VALQDIVGQSVAGFGYELVDIERSAGGLLRVTIDWPWVAGSDRFISVEDCEKVTRQLHFALEVEGIEYRRLEVSSPGIDRPLRVQRDFERFTGETIELTLKRPLGANSQVNALRKKFRGRLEAAETDGVAGNWQIVWSDEPVSQPGRRPGKKRVEAPRQVLRFSLDELKEARLAPLVDFKGRKPRGTPQAGGISGDR
jgi:ribosome maturation factor RimP